MKKIILLFTLVFTGTFLHAETINLVCGLNPKSKGFRVIKN